MSEIRKWLEGIGLGQYADAFEANDIDMELLRKVDDQTLKDIGMSSAGNRLRVRSAIAELSPSDAGPSSEDSRATAERRQLTVMFCDLVGSTALSARLDPEDLRGIIGAYHRCCTEVIKRNGGFVAKYMGDGVLSYFGYPHAHEYDAERAVRAGLALVEAVPKLTTAAGVPLQVRIGIATGLVVVGDLIGSGEAQERGIVGETPNLAARLQGIAEPNMVIIADSTRRLLGTLFELQDLGVMDLKGIAAPVRHWVALRPSLVEGRFEALHAGGLTELVGREEELELLLRRWSKAKDREGQVVLLSGEAGIGKSRLTAALLERLAAEPHIRLRYFCSPQHTDSALYPIVSQMERAAGFAHDDTAEARLNKLDALLTPSFTSREDAALLAEMLSLPNDGRYPTLELVPQQRRQKTLEALTAQMETLSRSNPVLMIFEDAHWVDPTSLEALGRTVDRLRTLEMLLIVTYRPEFEPPWIGGPYVTVLSLNRLGEREIAAMIERVAGNKPLPASVRQDIIERTDGIPLFVEEMTKAVLEAENEADARKTAAAVPSSALAVPASLHASLMARLDRLGPAKEVVQIGAAIGREFSHALLAAVARKDEQELASALNRVVEAGLLFRQGAPPHASYLFKHALVRDAAYSTLLRSQRQALHARIGTMLKERFPEIAVTEPETLAHHYTQAGLHDLAIDYWHKAGERALRRSAMVEAVQHLTHAIELTRSLPVTPGRNRRELDLHVALGRFIRIVKGMAAPETLQVFTRARRLLDDSATVTEQMTVLYGLWGVHYVRAEHAEAREVANRCLDLAARHGRNEGAGVLANYIMGGTLWATGAFIEARRHLERTLQFGAAAGPSRVVARSSQNHDISALSYLAWTLWPLGYPAKATAAAKQALRRARDTGHVPLIAFVSFVDAFLAAAFGADRDRREARFDEVVTFCAEHGVKAYELWTRCCQGIAAAYRGDAERGIAVRRGAMAELEAINAEILRPLHLGHLAAARASLGQAEAGITLIDEAIATLEKTGERLFEAELYRLRGELSMRLGKTDEAETALLRALTVARGQQARMWELRAAVGLARLQREQGRSAPAHNLLAPVYGWFTEGFDTLVLKEAKLLLDQLSA